MIIKTEDLTADIIAYIKDNIIINKTSLISYTTDELTLTNTSRGVYISKFLMCNHRSNLDIFKEQYIKENKLALTLWGVDPVQNIHCEVIIGRNFQYLEPYTIAIRKQSLYINSCISDNICTEDIDDVMFNVLLCSDYHKFVGSSEFILNALKIFIFLKENIIK